MGKKGATKGQSRRQNPPDHVQSSWTSYVGQASVTVFVSIGILLWSRPRFSPYVHLGRTLAEEELLHVEAESQRMLAKTANASEKRTRQFGDGQDYLAGHRVIFLDHAALSVLPRLLDAVALADRKAGWKLLSPGRDVRRQLTPRCAELIEYEAFEADPSRSHALGWHNDGSTLFTVAVSLSNPTDYDGGEFETYKSEGEGHARGTIVAVDKAARGDAFVWRGWERHRVRPVTRGLRRVFVVEFWQQPSLSDLSDLERPADTLRSFRDALTVAPDAPGLHQGLGLLLLGKERHDEAAASLTTALKLAPARADFHDGLGQIFYLQQRVGSALKHVKGLKSLTFDSDRTGELQKMAENSLLKALALDPTVGTAHKSLIALYHEIGDNASSAKHRDAYHAMHPSAAVEPG